MHGNAQALGIAAFLSPQHPASHSHQALARRANVLLQGDHHLLRHNRMESGHHRGHFFFILGVNSTKK